MVQFLLFLCFTIIMLFSMTFAFDKRYYIKSIISIIIVAISIYLIPAFYKLQRENGNPDGGKEFEQLYFPILVFIICAFLGVIMFIYFLYKVIQGKKSG